MAVYWGTVSSTGFGTIVLVHVENNVARQKTNMHLVSGSMGQNSRRYC